MKQKPLYYDKDGKLHYDGSIYPDRCSCCGSFIQDQGIVLLDTDLIFCNEECLIKMVEQRTADIRIDRKGGSKCIVN